MSLGYKTVVKNFEVIIIGIKSGHFGGKQFINFITILTIWIFSVYETSFCFPCPWKWIIATSCWHAIISNTYNASMCIHYTWAYLRWWILKDMRYKLICCNNVMIWKNIEGIFETVGDDNSFQVQVFKHWRPLIYNTFPPYMHHI